MGTTSAIIITQDAAELLCDFRYTEQAADQVDSYFTIKEMKGSLPVRAGERAHELGAKSFAYEPGYCTVAELQAVQKGFPGSAKAHADVVSSLRMVKSTREIQAIRDASALAEKVLADAKALLKPGVTEREVA